MRYYRMLWCTVPLKWVCKHLFCVPLNFFSCGSFVSIFFSAQTSVSPLCADLTAVFVYMGRKCAEWYTIKQPPPNSSNLKLLQSSQLPIKNQYRLILYWFLRTYGTHMPSTIKMDPDHGEKWLPTALNYTVTRGLLTFLAAVIFIPWPLGSYRYLTCHHRPDIKIRLASWKQMNSSRKLQLLIYSLRIRQSEFCVVNNQ